MHYLTTEQARRLEQMLTAYERGDLSPQSQQGPDPRWLPPFRRFSIAKTGAAISAASGATPGSGSVTLQTLSSSGDLVATSTATVTAYSFVATASGTSVYVAVVQDDRGNWWYVAEDCA